MNALTEYLADHKQECLHNLDSAAVCTCGRDEAALVEAAQSIYPILTRERKELI